jgi:periplasmic mercuric ion binding protein
MKSIKTSTLLFIILGMMMSFTFAKTEEVKIKTTAVCGMCKQTIERNLTLTAGVKSAVLNLEDKVVSVQFNPKKITVEGIKNAISLSGYDADEVKKDMKSHAELPACCREGCNAAH